MRWIVTRPQADSEALARQLAKRGHQAIISPVSRIGPRDFECIDWAGYSAVVFTSRNGVAMAQPFPPVALTIPVFTVGDATANAARKAGFSNVVSAQGDVEDLGRRLVEDLPAGRGPVLHLCGNQAHGDLEAAIAAKGRGFERIVVYEMHLEPALSISARDALAHGRADGAILLSPLSARHFAELATAAGFVPLPAKFIFLANSKATTMELTALGGRITTAKSPNLDCVLDLLP